MFNSILVLAIPIIVVLVAFVALMIDIVATWRLPDNDVSIQWGIRECHGIGSGYPDLS